MLAPLILEAQAGHARLPAARGGKRLGDLQRLQDRRVVVRGDAIQLHHGELSLPGGNHLQTVRTDREMRIQVQFRSVGYIGLSLCDQCAVLRGQTAGVAGAGHAGSRARRQAGHRHAAATRLVQTPLPPHWKGQSG